MFQPIFRTIRTYNQIILPLINNNLNPLIQNIFKSIKTIILEEIPLQKATVNIPFLHPIFDLLIKPIQVIKFLRL